MNERVPKFDINIQHDINEHFNLHIKDNSEKFIASSTTAHSHNYYILTILYEGTIPHLADFEDEHISAPAVLLLDIDQVHTHPEMSNCRLLSMAFSSNFITDQNDRFLDKLNNVFSRPFIKICQDDLDQLDEVIKIIVKHYFKKNKEVDLIKALLNVLIVQCAKLSMNYPQLDSQRNELYAGFRAALKKNYCKHHQVKFYADKLNVSTTVLNHAVKHSTLKTPKQLIDEYLLIEAKRLLYWSEVSGKELAWKLGFETDSYFNHFFKKHTGITPKEFQRNARLC